MANTLSLSLNDFKDINLTEQAKNITQGIGSAFQEAMKKATSKLDFPDDMGQAVKDGLEKIDIKSIGGKAGEAALREGLKSLGLKTSSFSGLKGILEAVKEGDLKKGLSSGVDTIVSFLKVPKVAKTIIKQSKDFIIDKAFGDELKTLMKKQQNTISRINKKCIEMEDAFNKNDTKTMDRVYKTLKSDVSKVMPIQDVINRGTAMLNKYELFKNKNGQAISEEELELLKKL